MSGNLLIIYICNFHVLSNLLLISICKLHWITTRSSRTLTSFSPVPLTFDSATAVGPGCSEGLNKCNGHGSCDYSTSTCKCFGGYGSEKDKLNAQSLSFNPVHLLMIYICNFHVLSSLLLIYICKLHWNLNMMFVCQVISF